MEVNITFNAAEIKKAWEKKPLETLLAIRETQAIIGTESEQFIKANMKRAANKKPSDPFAMPNIQSGNLRASIGSQAKILDFRTVSLHVGSIRGNRPVFYGKYLDEGTKNMLPRPYLKWVVENFNKGFWRKFLTAFNRRLKK